MNLKIEARRMREQKRRELEALYPALRTKKDSASPTPPVASFSPPALRENRIVLGRDRNGLVFSLSNESRFRHTTIIGCPGSGKSNSIVHGIKQDLLNGAAVVLTDPHGNHPDSVYQTLVRWLWRTGLAGRRKVHLVDPGSAFSAGFNPLDRPDDTDPTVIANNTLEAVERGWGDEDLQEKPTMRRALRAIFTALCELKLTLLEATLFLLPDDEWNARAWALRTLKDGRARAYFERLDRLAANPRMAQTFEVETVPVLNRLEEFTSSAATRRVFGQQKSIDLRAVMDGGDIVLVNCAGGTQVYEREGDLLGRMFLRSLVFNAARRTNNRPCFVWLDEGHRFVSGDLPVLFEEMRKRSVGVSIAHQDISQLGKPGDRIRESILAVPQNRMVFRLNSIAEATLLAPEVVKLNLEMPVGALIQPTVVGHEIRRMRLKSTGGGTTRTIEQSNTTTKTQSESAGTSVGGSKETNKTVSHTEGLTHSNSTTRGSADTVSEATTRSRSTTIGESESETHTSGISRTIGESGSQTVSSGAGSSTGREYGYDSPFPVGLPDSSGTSYGTDSSSASAQESGWSEATTTSESTSISRGRSRAETEGEAHTRGTSHTESTAETEGVARNTSRTVGKGQSEGRNWAKTIERGSSVGVGNSVGSSTGSSDTWSEGFTEGLVPIMEDRAGAVHGKENVVHMAAEVINTLPTGMAIVKALVGNKIEAGLVHLPRIDDPPERIEGEARAQLLARTPGVLANIEADKIIVARREWLRSQGAKLIADERAKRAIEMNKEPTSFAVSGDRWKNNPRRKGASNGRTGTDEN